MAWDKGFNFRATSGYVTDGADETYVIAEAYPVTRNGVTFGWETTPGVEGRDRNAGNDRRLAGLNFNATASATEDFRVDLPASGSFLIRLAMGDASNPQNPKVVLKDNTTVLDTLQTSVGTNEFYDATGVLRTQANWPGQNASITRTFASTILRAVIGDGTNFGTIAHLFVSQLGLSRTAKGTGANKTGTTVSTAVASFTAGDSIVACVSHDPDTVVAVEYLKDGTTAFSLAKDPEATNPGNVQCSIWSLHNIQAGNGSSFVRLTLTTTNLAKAIAALALTPGSGNTIAKDTSATGTGTGTAASTTSISSTPNTGLGVAWIGCVGTEGPDEDVAGVWVNPDNNGQRLGTTGGAGAANITVSEGYEIDTGAVTQALDKGSVTGFTSRDWAAVLCTYKEATGSTTTTKTITGVSRIRATATKTITGKAAIRKTVDRTITGVSRIALVGVQKTISGVSRIRKTATQTVTGVADIRKTTTRTIGGTARVQKTATQTITGAARITTQTQRTITGRAAIRKTTTRTITGVANISTGSGPPPADRSLIALTTGCGVGL